MKISIKILIGLLIAAPAYVQAQSSYLTLGMKEENMLDRLSIKTKSNQLSFSGIKPYLIQPTVKEVEYYDSLYYNKSKDAPSITEIDRYNMQHFLMANSEWSTPRESFKSEKPIYNTFYVNRANMFELKSNDFVLIANPIIYFEGGSKGGNDGYTYVNKRGINVRGIIGNKVGFSFYFTENQERQPLYVQEWRNSNKAVPGAGYIKDFKANGFDYFDVRGSVSWKVAKFMDMQFGYDKNFIGDGYRSLLLSDFSTSGLFLKVNTHFGRFNYENLFMELVSLHRLSSDYIYPRKYFRMSHLSTNITKWLNIGLFDGVILGKSDQLSLALFNPVIYAHVPNSEDGLSNKYYTGFDAKVNIAKKVLLYGQLMVDKLKLDELNDHSWNNRYGYQAGLKYVDAFGLKNVDVQLETNRVRPFTYSGSDSVKNYTHYNQPMTHPLGANFAEYIAIVKAQPMKKLYLEAKAIYYKRGLDSAGVNMGSNLYLMNTTRPRDYGWDVGTGDLAKCTILNLTASYEVKENLFFDLSLLHRKYTVASGIGDQSTTVFSASIRWNIGRRELLF